MGRAFEYRRKSKEQRWDKMSKLFPKLAKSITIAAREGGADPELNPKLRAAITNARAQNMPKDNIESAIKRASGKDSLSITEASYEGKGPHGVLIIVECATDNPTRTVANIKTCFSKAGGQVVPSGSLDFLFSRKAVVEFEVPEGADLGEIELNLIDGGLEELQLDEGTAYAYGDFTSFGSLCKAAEDMNLSVTRASLQRIPTSPAEFSDDQLAEIEKLVDRIEDDEDVQAVFTNIA